MLLRALLLDGARRLGRALVDVALAVAVIGLGAVLAGRELWWWMRVLLDEWSDDWGDADD